MPLRSGNMYFIRESSEFPTTITDLQLTTTLVVIHTRFDAINQTLHQTQERLGRVETRLENHNECKEPDPNHNEREEKRGSLTPYQRRNKQDPYDQYLKGIKLDVPTFDGHLDP